MYFLDVKTDYAFKKVFGSLENKDILISFLNSLIDFPNNRYITSLEIVDPYNIPMLKGMKDTYVDVKALLDNGTMVIIEMQILNHSGLEKRILYNVAKNYSVQLTQAEDYTLLNPVIALTIVDFDMFPDTQSVVSRFKLLEKESFINYADDIELIFIELPKFKKQLENLKNIKDQWIYFIKNAGSLEYVPESLSPTVKQALNVVNTAGFSKEELEIQHKRKEFIFIQNASIDKATKDGLKKGIKKGIEQGIEKRDIVIVKNMYNSGSTINYISEITGLDQDKIKQYLNKKVN
ncbi:Rpn family recombination-promoting nuclease/putative transposase [Thiospirochaeta perfilievii]|uniref:Rpn family recombination-promoting nuclease/putative transposase n=1 Tax=Thiospirochaeta perfilievii TaxID=252967 RepID=A0A5C1QET9_9SPIO|nr:Rpn family recombination-promoting nuclease/putative transposase [Thiospirochaeta perfilievii]QEN05590.1 Rpn family recombination-promoting nuclease/putative transposase [Thiospirochaeta perfilievii]